VTDETNKKMDKGTQRLKDAGEEYLQRAEEKLRDREYLKVGELYFKAVAAQLRSACTRLDVEFKGKEDYFPSMAELTARAGGVDWAERSLCQAVILHQNDERDFLTHDQVRRFGGDVRRLIRWLKGL